jgi:transcriptional regulator with XRE-family HTH domain
MEQDHRRDTHRPLLLLAVHHCAVVLSTVDKRTHCSVGIMAPSIGSVLRQSREVRELSAVEAARAAGISAAYLSKLENDAVKKPSPHVLLQLSEALAVPYADLMQLSGYHVPGESKASPGRTVSAALFADVTDEEMEELLDYLAWFRARRRSGRGADRGGRAQTKVAPGKVPVKR